MIIDKVKDTIIKNNLISKGEHIVIGLSGGPDSVCLFHILYQLRGAFDLTLHAVHINHKLRPGAAEEDEHYVEKLAKSFGVDCHLFSYDVNEIATEKRISAEDAGRQVRYGSFYQVADVVAKDTGKTVKIAIAQNMNDQAETILMRIMRGTGTDGLAGIEYIRQSPRGHDIIRPLLDITREEIENYCRENSLNPRIDLTNLQPVYTRNKIRLELIPYMMEHFNENVIAALVRLSQIAKEDNGYLYQQAEDLVKQHGILYKADSPTDYPQNYHYPIFQNHSQGDLSKATFPVDILQNAHNAIRHRIYKLLFERIGLVKDIEAVHMEQGDRLLENAKTSSSVDFPDGYAMKISYDMAEFYQKPDVRETTIEYEITPGQDIHIPELKGQLRVKILNNGQWQLRKEEIKNTPTKSYSCSLNYDAIISTGGRLLLRNRRPGDYFIPLGMKGRKKLQDYFVDEKIEKDLREFIPLLCIGSEILWIMGRRIHENYKITEETKEILLLEYYPTT
ncbi:MAG: tRNA lysidine(34) synthetase TilS [Anaerovoracaceae bacterium]|jgi:tRNA(Ile)-lysidine synthase